jgi:hypothetical protein
MTVADFRRIALSLDGVDEYSHAGLPAFRVGGRKFASLASQAQGYGNLMLTLEQQAAFVDELPEIFLPIPGGWGRMGHTHIRVAAASEDVVARSTCPPWSRCVTILICASSKPWSPATKPNCKPSSQSPAIFGMFRYHRHYDGSRLLPNIEPSSLAAV